MAHPISPADLQDWVGALGHRSSLVEVAVLMGCVGLAWLVVWRLGRKRDRSGSVWLGKRVIDGALFPIMALVFALVARRVLLEVYPALPVFRLMVPILVSLLVIRASVKVLRAAFPASHFVRVVERWISWVAWIGLVLWVTGLLPMVMEEFEDITWKVGSTKISLRNVIEGLFSAVVVMVVALWLSAAIEAQLLRSTDNLSIRKIAANAVRSLLLFVGLIFALSAAGIDLTALSVLGGAVGVGLGFGLQKLASNYVSGFVILAERSVRIGDLVKVDNFEGRITDINTRYTVIRSASGRESIVPNELLIIQRVENASLADTSMMLSTVFQVPYGTDVVALRPKLLAAINSVERVMKQKANEVGIHLTNFAPDGLELTVWFWIADPINGQSNVRSEVNLAILATLEAEGVSIPFPQRVVTMISPEAAVADSQGLRQIGR